MSAKRPASAAPGPQRALLRAKAKAEQPLSGMSDEEESLFLDDLLASFRERNCAAAASQHMSDSDDDDWVRELCQAPRKALSLIHI